ncbi:hypothetical protein C0033_01175 [Clostridium sp. chh4-2]|uniref:hypothetical protein n=1 Tax=Clostridium sp. chh4-2 TaxID=2067550 RepID=UPI000CCE8231|nr:hypothetical protein [Clostridium sp. chh4-2]PNV63967.1 hypothetical protein C0033_01175 [Clostridium sp. chh4-2]
MKNTKIFRKAAVLAYVSGLLISLSIMMACSPKKEEQNLVQQEETVKQNHKQKKKLTEFEKVPEEIRKGQNLFNIQIGDETLNVCDMTIEMLDKTVTDYTDLHCVWPSRMDKESAAKFMIDERTGVDSENHSITAFFSSPSGEYYMSCSLFNPYADKKISVKECFITSLDITLDKLEDNIYVLDGRFNKKAVKDEVIEYLEAEKIPYEDGYDGRIVCDGIGVYTSDPIDIELIFDKETQKLEMVSYGLGWLTIVTLSEQK